MNEKDSNSNKTTIRVKLSDDYQDIVIGWRGKTSDGIRESIIAQLSAFTRIPSEKIKILTFRKPGNGVPGNPFTPYDPLAIACLHYFWDYSGRNIKEIRDHFFTDGDCFMLNTKLLLTFDLDKTYVRYVLTHPDLIDETECSTDHCHHTCNRAFLDKQAEIFNSDFDSYLLAQPRRIRPLILTGEHFFDMESRKIEILANFNIGQYFDSHCCRSPYVALREQDNLQIRIYLPCRG